MGIHRPTRLLKALLIAGIAAASLTGTSVVAHAYPPPEEHHDIDCTPGHVDEENGSCSVVFTDRGEKHERSGQLIHFTVDGRGSVKPAFARTNEDGQARTTYFAGRGDCSDDHTTATIEGTEVSRGDEAGSAQTVVKIDCDHKGDGAAPVTTSAHNTGSTQTGAAVAGIGPAQVLPAVAILAVVLMLSVAITGRLRLRRLRR